MSMKRILLLLGISLAGIAFAGDTASGPLSAVPPKEGDYLIHNFRVAGQTLQDVRMHYTTLGTPRRDAQGRVTNAVVVLHGTNRKGGIFMIPGFAGELFGPGQILDTSRYFIVLPDQFGAGLGKSTKPSDGLRGQFSHYDYADMIRAVQIMLKDGLGVDHLRLLIGCSMGCMQGFMWGESTPDYMDGMMLLSCNPAEVAGRNRMVRKIMIDDVRRDPGYMDGNYTNQPYGLRAAMGHLLVVGSAPSLWQKEYPTSALADKYVEEYIESNLKTTDANDFIYQYDASRNYNPAPGLDKIRAHVSLVNVQDDFWNPGELDVAREGMQRVRNGEFVLLPVSDQTRGHYTFLSAPVWRPYLKALLESLSK
jgi:homoserine O-acetyltransferase